MTKDRKIEELMEQADKIPDDWFKQVTYSPCRIKFEYSTNGKKYLFEVGITGFEGNADYRLWAYYNNEVLRIGERVNFLITPLATGKASEGRKIIKQMLERAVNKLNAS